MRIPTGKVSHDEGKNYTVIVFSDFVTQFSKTNFVQTKKMCRSCRFVQKNPKIYRYCYFIQIIVIFGREAGSVLSLTMAKWALGGERS